MTPAPAAASKPPLTGLGILCVVLGAVLAIPSGACTGLAVVMMATEGGDFAEALSIMALVLMFSGLPMVGGAALIWAGLRMRRVPA